MSTHYVRTDVQAYLDQLKANPRPPMSDELIAMMRNLPPEVLSQLAVLDLPVGELGEIRNVSMPGPGGEIALRLFDPRASREAGPVMVFYHGGGFVAGSIDTHAGMTAEIARSLDLPVISVEYRLAPENPWPAGIDDAEAAAVGGWVVPHRDGLVTRGGNSAPDAADIELAKRQAGVRDPQRVAGCA